MKAKVNIILSLLTLSSLFALGQVRPPIVSDTLRLSPSTIPDSIPVVPGQQNSIDWDSIKISKDGIEEQVDYLSKDSMFFDVKNKQIHLYGQAEVKYQSMTIKADYILIDWNDNTFSAEGRQGPNGQILGKPQFSEGTQQFTASRMKYNFKTYKGIIYDAQTQQEGMNIVGQKGKFFGTGNDTTKSNVIYNRNAIFSTCNLDHPHFGIHSNKQKIVQDKVAIVGPSNLEIGGIPTPIWLPFGFFPLKLGNRTGLIFPQNYEYSEAFGFGLERVGWYFPMSDTWDFTLTGDIYFKGSARIHASSNYYKRYKFRGNVGIDIARLRTEVNGLPKFENSMSLRWSHNQDGKAHPYRNLGGSVNIQTGNYQRRNQTDAQSVLQTSLNSNMSFRQRFDAPFDLSASFSHSQNTTSRDVTISFPTVNFQTETLYPFKRKIPGGRARWYEQIQMRYSSEVRNQFTAKDTTLFTRKTLDDAKYGVRHNITAGTSFNLLKYFNFSPNATYKEVWYFKTTEKEFDPTPVVEIDTIYNADSTEIGFVRDTTQYGSVIDMQNFGFKPFRQYSMGMSMSTRIFGTVEFKKGKLRGLRHVISPSFGFSFSPDYTNPDWGYFKSVRTDLRSDEEIIYNIFENNRLGGFETPSYTGRQMALSYGFSNLLEAKVYSKKDSTEKKVNLFRSINVSGNYNFAADSLQWSQVNISGNTSFFNGISNFRFSTTFDPYDHNPKTGGRINKFYWDTKGKLLRFVNYNVGLNTDITIGRLRDLFRGVDTDTRVANLPPQGEAEQEEDFLSLFEDFGISHSFSVNRQYNSRIGKDTTIITSNSISSSGSIRLTNNWSVRVGNFGYDFQAKRVTYPDFGFERDLHCWQMSFYWQPFYGTYSFSLRVKPGKLDFINIPFRKNIQDARRGF